MDLHGFSATGPPTTPEDALRRFLDAFGIPPDRVPARLDARAALFRSLVADRRMLVVPDNAATTAQDLPDALERVVDFYSHTAYTGRHHHAVEHYHRALALYRDVGNTYEIAATLDNLGHSHAALGQHPRVREVWREALQLYREQGRDTVVERVQRQLDGLTAPGEHGHP
ncbi:tetratricopeptide repeat protein [Actinosynnema sp. CS-041913]|uniref:tetratricopeptide repeat protein n=1 Tax=Actinosynnema sp. CS-041913 TaxID=3239917 RepID=UPI003D949CB0